MKKLIKKIIMVYVCAIIVFNAIYIGKTINRINNYKESIIKMKKLGIGSSEKLHIRGNMYWFEYDVEIKEDENGHIKSVTTWK